MPESGHVQPLYLFMRSTLSYHLSQAALADMKLIYLAGDLKKALILWFITEADLICGHM
jgi:hypothetical protein